MNQSIESLLQDQRIWRGGALPAVAPPGAASGFVALDSQLPGHGWPPSAVVELQHDRHGLGEIRVLLPVLASFSQAGGKIALIGPPYQPYAPAWANAGIDLRQLLWLVLDNDNERLWAGEQCLRAGACRAVLLWLGREPDARSWRRLQLAAEAGASTGWVLLQTQLSGGQSPVGLRLRLSREQAIPQFRILKRRGAPLQQPLPLAELDTPFARVGHWRRAITPAAARLRNGR